MHDGGGFGTAGQYRKRTLGKTCGSGTGISKPGNHCKDAYNPFLIRLKEERLCGIS